MKKTNTVNQITKIIKQIYIEDNVVKPQLILRALKYIPLSYLKNITIQIQHSSIDKNKLIRMTTSGLYREKIQTVFLLVNKWIYCTTYKQPWDHFLEVLFHETYHHHQYLNGTLDMDMYFTNGHYRAKIERRAEKFAKKTIQKIKNTNPSFLKYKSFIIQS